MRRKGLYYRVFIISFLIYFLQFSQFVNGQASGSKVDSLIQALKTERSDTARVNIQNIISRNLLQAGDLVKGLKYAKEALSFAEKKNYKKGITDSYDNIGVIYSLQGNYAEAMKILLLALKTGEEIRYKKGMINSYNGIGGVYLSMENYSESIKNHLEALKLAKQINDRKLIAYSYGNLGNSYSNEKNYSEALRNFKESLKILEEINDKRGIIVSNISIGVLYLKVKNYNEALKYFNIAQKLSKETDNKLALAVSYVNMGEAYIKLNKLDEAKQCFINGLPISRAIGSKNYTRKFYLGLSNVDSLRGDFKGAYLNFRLYSRIKDSILSEESNKQISQMKIKYETEKKDREIELNNVKIERQKNTIRYIIGGFAVLIIFAFIFLFQYNQRRKSTHRHKVLETEMKALRSQMNPHFTFNVLNSIQYFISEKDLDSAEKYIEKFASLIRMILDQSRTAYITLEQEITILKTYLELEEMRFEKKFTYTMNVDGNIDTGKLLIPGMLVQPVVENAIKHGIRYKEGEALINISFSAKDSILVCRVTDNGIGLEEAKRLGTGGKHKSAGTSIIKERIDALSSIYNIKLDYKTENLYDSEGKPEGIQVTIEIPIGIKEEET